MRFRHTPTIRLFIVFSRPYNPDLYNIPVVLAISPTPISSLIITDKAEFHQIKLPIPHASIDFEVNRGGKAVFRIPDPAEELIMREIRKEPDPTLTVLTEKFKSLYEKYYADKKDLFKVTIGKFLSPLQLTSYYTLGVSLVIPPRALIIAEALKNGEWVRVFTGLIRRLKYTKGKNGSELEIEASSLFSEFLNTEIVNAMYSGLFIPVLFGSPEFWERMEKTDLHLFLALIYAQFLYPLQKFKLENLKDPRQFVTNLDYVTFISLAKFVGSIRAGSIVLKDWVKKEYGGQSKEVFNETIGQRLISWGFPTLPAQASDLTIEKLVELYDNYVKTYSPLAFLSDWGGLYKCDSPSTKQLPMWFTQLVSLREDFLKKISSVEANESLKKLAVESFERVSQRILEAIYAKLTADGEYDFNEAKAFLPTSHKEVFIGSGDDAGYVGYSYIPFISPSFRWTGLSFIMGDKLKTQLFGLYRTLWKATLRDFNVEGDFASKLYVEVESILSKLSSAFGLLYCERPDGRVYITMPFLGFPPSIQDKIPIFGFTTGADNLSIEIDTSRMFSDVSFTVGVDFIEFNGLLTKLFLWNYEVNPEILFRYGQKSFSFSDSLFVTPFLVGIKESAKINDFIKAVLLYANMSNFNTSFEVIEYTPEVLYLTGAPATNELTEWGYTVKKVGFVFSYTGMHGVAEGSWGFPLSENRKLLEVTPPLQIWYDYITSPLYASTERKQETVSKRQVVSKAAVAPIAKPKTPPKTSLDFAAVNDIWQYTVTKRYNVQRAFGLISEASSGMKICKSYFKEPGWLEKLRKVSNLKLFIAQKLKIRSDEVSFGRREFTYNAPKNLKGEILPICPRWYFTINIKGREYVLGGADKIVMVLGRGEVKVSDIVNQLKSEIERLLLLAQANQRDQIVKEIHKAFPGIDVSRVLADLNLTPQVHVVTEDTEFGSVPLEGDAYFSPAPIVWIYYKPKKYLEALRELKAQSGIENFVAVKNTGALVYLPPDDVYEQHIVIAANPAAVGKYEIASLLYNEQILSFINSVLPVLEKAMNSSSYAAVLQGSKFEVLALLFSTLYAVYGPTINALPATLDLLVSDVTADKPEKYFMQLFNKHGKTIANVAQRIKSTDKSDEEKGAVAEYTSIFDTSRNTEPIKAKVFYYYYTIFTKYFAAGSKVRQTTPISGTMGLLHGSWNIQ
ncbi:MAG: hypothetical protein QXY76_03330 [Nitrososphaeria archaeon]